MKENLGKSFKVLRESKGLSQKGIAGDIISITQLSRSKRGISSISTETLYNYLENMNVSIEESQCVCRDFLQNQNAIFRNGVAKAFLEKSTLKLREYLVKYQRLTTITPEQKFYRLNTIVIKSVSYRCDDFDKVAREDIQFLVDCLFSVDEWGRYELWLFTYSASLIPSNLVEIFACEVINRTQFYQGVPENRRLINQMLFSIIVVCIEKSRLSLAFKSPDYADNLKRGEMDLFTRNAVKYCRGYYLCKKDNLSGLAIMEKCTEIMIFLECYIITQQMSDRVTNLKQEKSHLQKEMA